MERNYLRKLLDHLRTIFDLESSGRVLLYSPIIGVVAGLGAAAFYFCLEWTQSLFLGRIEGYYPPPAGTESTEHIMQLPTHWWAVVLVPTIGGLICGILVYCFAPEAEGHGTDAIVKSFHRNKGAIRARVPLIKAIASIVTIGTGGSAGREGPIAQIGAGFGSFLATRLGLGDRDRRLLMLSGAAGGIGSIFRAPMGGALFVSEVLYSSTAVEFEAFVPAVISSITAYTVFASIYGQGLAFTTRATMAMDVSELPFYVGFAVVCSVVGYLYVKCFYGLRNRFFRKLPIPNLCKPAIGGLVLGIMALWLPQVMAGGYGWIQKGMNGEMTIRLMLLLCFAKIVATSFTISSGGSGGVFAPSLFIGAMLGGAYGQTCNYLFPEMNLHPEAFVLVGMGGFFAGVAKVPLTAMLMVCEMSGSYALLVPLMLVSIVNVAFLSSRWTLYEEQVPAIIDSPAHLGDFMIDVLEQIRTKEIMKTNRKLDLIPQNMPLPEILKLASWSSNIYFPVVDESQKLVGIFSLRDLRSAFTGYEAGGLVLASDIATQPVLTVCPDDDLHTALRRFTQKNIEELPVVDPTDAGRIIGMLSRKDLISAYHDRLDELRHDGNGAARQE